MSAPCERRDCPVLTCTATIPADQTMCAKCYGALPKHMQVAMDAAVRAVRRQPTTSNRNRLNAAVKNAIRMAAAVQS